MTYKVGYFQNSLLILGKKINWLTLALLNQAMLVIEVSANTNETCTTDHPQTGIPVKTITFDMVSDNCAQNPNPQTYKSDTVIEFDIHDKSRGFK